MAQPQVEQRVGQLTQVLGEMKRLHDELAVVVRNKLAAMRAADADRLRSATSREEFLTGRLREQDGLRKQLLELIGATFGIDPKAARQMCVRDLADRVAEPMRSRLLGLAAALRERVTETAEVNRVAAVVTHEMLKHFRSVYETMARATASAGVYSRTGQTERCTEMNVFNAVV
jgi:hypothetical protein